MKKNVLKAMMLVAGCYFASTAVQAQNVGINSTGATPDASAALDVSATNKGILFPRVALTGSTDVTTIASPATSLVVYNTATVSDVLPGFYSWGGSSWIGISSEDNDWTIDADTLYSALDSTVVIKPSDVYLNGRVEVNPATNEALVFKHDTLGFGASKWSNIRMMEKGTDGLYHTTWKFHDRFAGNSFVFENEDLESVIRMTQNKTVNIGSAGDPGNNRLQVVSVARNSGAGADTTLNLWSYVQPTTNSADYPGINFTTNKDGGTAWGEPLSVGYIESGLTNTDATNYEAVMNFKVANVGGGLSTKMAINSNGHIGVGVAPSSGYMMTLNTQSNLDGINIRGNSSGIDILAGTGDGASTTTYNGAIQSWNGLVFRSHHNNNVSHVFNLRNGQTYFQGNLGLGVQAPARKLHVSDAMRLEPIATAPTSPAEGDIYMDSTTHKLMVYDGTTWQACW